jgi:fumarate reductase subunit D
MGDLTAGRRWQIFWAAVLFFIPFVMLSFAIYLPLGFIESLNIMPVEVVLDCILDIAYAVLQIVLFLFYWESTQDQRRVDKAPNGGPAASFGDSVVTVGSPSVSKRWAL